ncbi:tail fiber protein [Crassaminicella thermophila]|uniref:tail fiber protein n=1 Tax=Crassaminicella thermophila TaxID=2599308 RepID=UPI001A9B00F8|nr:tail fiber protein [Crassaminicella thermophila]
MPDLTTNIGLKKPAGNETADIDMINENMDIIDAEVAKKASATEDGRMSKEDKTKLDSIEDNANNYQHPSVHPATMITEDSTHRFVTDSEKSDWNSKETPAGAQAKANVAEQNAKNYADSIKPTKLSQLSNDVGYITAQRAVSDSVTSTSSTVAASSKAVKTAYDKANDAYSKVTSATYVRDRVKAADGHGSGLDADLLDGWHRDSIRDWNHLLNRPSSLPANGGNADSVDGLHFREYNESLQYYYGGKWKDVTAIGNASNTVIGSAVTNTDKYKYTVAHSYNGSGILTHIGMSASNWDSNNYYNTGKIKLVIDDVVLYDGTVCIIYHDPNGDGQAFGFESVTLLQAPIKFNSNITIYHMAGSDSYGSAFRTIWNYIKQ